MFLFQISGTDWKSSDAATDIPLECYHFLCKKTYKEQEALYQLLLNADAYKSL